MKRFLDTFGPSEGPSMVRDKADLGAGDIFYRATLDFVNNMDLGNEYEQKGCEIVSSSP